MSDSGDELYSSTSDSSDIDDVSEYRDMCDKCVEPYLPGFCGAVVTHWRPERLIRYRDMAESVLKAYNKSELKSFKLLEVCKVNVVVTYFCLTFRAQEDGSQERPLFRGVFRPLTDRVVFVELKEDEEITLPAASKADSGGVKTGSSDVGVISTLFQGRVGSEKKRRKTNHGKKVLGDGSKADSGGVKHGRTTSSTTFKECVGSKKKRRETNRRKKWSWRRWL